MPLPPPLPQAGSILDEKAHKGDGIDPHGVTAQIQNNNNDNNNLGVSLTCSSEDAFQFFRADKKCDKNFKHNDDQTGEGATTTIVTDKNFKGVKWEGAQWIKFKECRKAINNFIMLQFYGCITKVEFDGVLLPVNLVLVLKTSVVLEEITFNRVQLRGLKMHCLGKIICPKLSSITFVGHRKTKTLTKDEGKIIKFMGQWLIFKCNFTLNFLIDTKSGQRSQRGQSSSSCCCSPSMDPQGSDNLLEFLLENASRVKQVKLADGGGDVCSEISCHWLGHQSVFERINENCSFEKYCNRFLEFLDPAKKSSKFDDVMTLQNIQFSFLDFHASQLPRSRMFDILRVQRSLTHFYYCDVDGSQVTLEILAGTVRACQSTLMSLTISIPYSGRKGISKKLFYPQNLDLKFLENCRRIENLCLLCNKRKRLVNTSSIPPHSLRQLKIIAAFGFKEVPKLFDSIRRFNSLETFECHNVYYYKKLLIVNDKKQQQKEEDSPVFMNGITADLVKDLFQAVNLRFATLSDKHMDRPGVLHELMSAGSMFDVKTCSGVENEGDGDSKNNHNYSIEIFRKVQ